MPPKSSFTLTEIMKNDTYGTCVNSSQKCNLEKGMGVISNK